MLYIDELIFLDCVWEGGKLIGEEDGDMSI